MSRPQGSGAGEPVDDPAEQGTAGNAAEKFRQDAIAQAVAGIGTSRGRSGSFHFGRMRRLEAILQAIQSGILADKIGI